MYISDFPGLDPPFDEHPVSRPRKTKNNTGLMLVAPLLQHSIIFEIDG
jgi:hypothetical protein